MTNLATKFARFFIDKELEMQNKIAQYKNT